MTDSERVLSLLSDDQYTALADDDAELASVVYYLTLCEQLDATGQFMTQEDIAASLGMSYNTLLKRRHGWKESGNLDKARLVFNEIKRESILIAAQRVASQWGLLLERALTKAKSTDNIRDLVPLLKFLKEEAITPFLADTPADQRDESDYMRKLREAKLKAALDSGEKS